jgi:uncharacterized protein (DUF58 family)
VDFEARAQTAAGAGVAPPAQGVAPDGTPVAESLRRYLDPRVLSRISDLEIRTRLVVEGFLAGYHRSPYLGLSVEFAQHREYVPGDDLKFIDWHVYGRSDRYFIKQYEAETNLRCTFLVDVSESMKYAGAARTREGLTKFDYAASVAASLALLLLRQQDAVGVVTFDQDWVTHLPPTANPNQIKSICRVLSQAGQSLKAKTALEAVCHRACEALELRGLVCVISDLFVDDPAAALRSLIRLTHRGHDVMVMHLLDEDELVFPFEGNTQFVALEEQGELTGEGRALRDGYLEALNEYLRFVRRECVSHRMDYAMVNTSENLGAVLARFLANRLALARRSGARRR